MRILSFIFLLLLEVSCKKSSQDTPANIVNYSGPSSCNIMNKKLSIKPQIVGGNPATDSSIITGSNTVALILNESNSSTKKIICSGTIVQSNLILTAGHCFDDVNQNSTSPGIVVFADSFVNYTASQSLRISCWQRPTNYRPCSSDNSYNCILNDIAWVKFNGSLLPNYNIVQVLKDPLSISNTETKWMAGFGNQNDSGSNNSLKNVVASIPTISNPDSPPSGAIQQFNSYTFANAYQSYLTVIGPNVGKGTCEGDSGGPVYVLRNNNYVLAAITQGSNNLLSPHPLNSSPPYQFDTNNYATCQDGYGVYTTIGNYVNWIQVSSGITLSTY
ncbi:trypsin-like serine protease [Pigmentibacter sp. JX0631]|uniref:S1 family peptidase n=1 Tax=Pigmentibacter sp. JX0631 TaxID=2976982 RepID=UPI0024696EAF|nr:trypsin-like serine protease [Pigmentibacter sp. JX0631]WGL59711.1 trypsin-like serine protease [Pigmentibacter sp. JX0631]